MRIGKIRFATHFLILQSMVDKRNTLKSIMTSPEWAKLKDVRDHRENVEIEVVKAVQLLSEIWRGMRHLVKLLDPIVEMLIKVDIDDKPSMGLLHHWVTTTKSKFDKIPSDNQWLIGIFNRRWDDILIRKNTKPMPTVVLLKSIKS